jgi:hypothetical protein
VIPDRGRRIGGELTDQIPLMRKAENAWFDLEGPECMYQVDNEAFETADVQTENDLQGFQLHFWDVKSCNPG